MNWKLLVARDSMLWVIMFYGALVVVAIASAPQGVIDTFPSWFQSAMPTIRLLSYVSLVVGGKMGLSFTDKKGNLQ